MLLKPIRESDDGHWPWSPGDQDDHDEDTRPGHKICDKLPGPP